MNFFFGFNNEILKSELTIPKFNNHSVYSDYSIFSAKPQNNEWIVEKIECEEDDHFYFIDDKLIKNDLFFFLAHCDQIEKKNYFNIKDFSNKNNFTDTKPSAFRANLKIYIKDGGFSSYQSEYPHSMTLKKGNILSPIHSLLDKDADENLILFRNIYDAPNNDESKIFFIDIKSKEVLTIKKVKNNFSNQIGISKTLISKNVYIFSEQALGIPLYISIKDNHISFEHTHPPHHYILDEKQFSATGKLKNEIKEKINENN